jgi:hypothetical protein
MSDLEIVNKIVADFCGEVVAEPVSFFSESDLQVVLSSKLRAAFPTSVSTSVKKGPRRDLKSTSTYKTGLVHNEYGATESRRIDIVIFSKDDLATVDDYKLRHQGKYLKPQFAFELGTEGIAKVQQHLASDIAKLRNRVSQRGFVIHFYRDTTLADTGTKDRENKEESIKARFRSPFEECVPAPRISALAFVLRIGHTHRKIWGKCELFNPITKKWNRTNIGNVSESVLDQLQSGVVAALEEAT